MPSRFGLVVEGCLVLALFCAWTALYIFLNPPAKYDLGLETYYSLGGPFVPLKQ